MRTRPPEIYAAHDFEATIRIFRPDEGGHKTAPFNGIRWDFAYDDEHSNLHENLPTLQLYMIWPEFFDDEGHSLPKDHPLLVDVPLRAKLIILDPKYRTLVHRKRIAPGVRFFCHEASGRVAQGVVTKITGLCDTDGDWKEPSKARQEERK